MENGRGYFATGIEEKAAKWDMLERRQRLEAHLAVLKDRRAAIGRTLEGFGHALRNESWRFEAGVEKISGHTLALAGVPSSAVSISAESLSFEGISSLVGDMVETTAEIEILSRRLEEAGIRQKL